MRHSMIFANSASLFLLLVLCMTCLPARAQNQTPANAPQPVGWTDPVTGLNWTSEDNGTDVNWNQAVAYCTNLRLGGYSDWRLPTIDELVGIYDPAISVPGQWYGRAVSWHVKGNLKITSKYEWSSTQKNVKDAWTLPFAFNKEDRISFSIHLRYPRALCVRR